MGEDNELDVPSENPPIAKGLSWCIALCEPEIVFISWVKSSPKDSDWYDLLSTRAGQDA